MSHVWVTQITQTGKKEERDSKRVGVPVTLLRFADGRRINNNESSKALEKEQDDVGDFARDRDRGWDRDVA